jgi:hypothetical protein
VPSALRNCTLMIEEPASRTNWRILAVLSMGSEVVVGSRLCNHDARHPALRKPLWLLAFLIKWRRGHEAPFCNHAKPHLAITCRTAPDQNRPCHTRTVLERQLKYTP